MVIFIKAWSVIAHLLGGGVGWGGAVPQCSTRVKGYCHIYVRRGVQSELDRFLNPPETKFRDGFRDLNTKCTSRTIPCI